MDTCPRNLAARAGRWSAQHRKKAIFGWLAFVIVAVVVGASVGTKTLSDSDTGIGESGRADDAISAHFPDEGSESVLWTTQSRAVVNEVVARLERTRNVQNVSSPYGRDNAGQLSEDGRSALVTFELPGPNPDDKVDPSLIVVSSLSKQHPSFRIETNETQKQHTPAVLSA